MSTRGKLEELNAEIGTDSTIMKNYVTSFANRIAHLDKQNSIFLYQQNLFFLRSFTATEEN